MHRRPTTGHLRTLPGCTRQVAPLELGLHRGSQDAHLAGATRARSRHRFPDFPVLDTAVSEVKQRNLHRGGSDSGTGGVISRTSRSASSTAPGSVCSFPAAITILEAHDVILAEIASRLHFDDATSEPCPDSRCGAWFRRECRSTGSPARKIPSSRVIRAVSRQRRPSVRRDYDGCSEIERGAGIDREAFDLATAPLLEAVVTAPGPKHFAMEQRARRAVATFSRFTRASTSWTRALGATEHGVLVSDHDVIAECRRSAHQPAVRSTETVAACPGR